MFKAKRLDGKWVTGDFVKGKKRCYIIHCWDDGSEQDCMQFIEVDSLTVCRSVDIPNELGETVYEHDVFLQETDDKFSGVVYWIVKYGHYNDSRRHGFYLEKMGYGEIYSDFDILKNCRSLGSIHDNPVLVPRKFSKGVYNE